MPASSTTVEGTAPATALVDRLRVAAPDPSLPRYQRDRFGDDWDYDPSTGCNTRERVLAAEAVELRSVDDRCRPSGTWVSVYDGVTVGNGVFLGPSAVFTNDRVTVETIE